MYLVIASRGAPQLTENGIFSFGHLVPWETVQNYEWTPEGKYLIFRLKKSRPMFQIGALQVEDNLRDTVSELFKQRVPKLEA